MDRTYELTEIGAGGLVFRADGGQKVRFTSDLALIGVRRGVDFLEISGPARLSWPLRPGQWGVTAADWRASRIPDSHYTRNGWRLTSQRLAWRVEDYEDVTVPDRAFGLLNFEAAAARAERR